MNRIGTLRQLIEDLNEQRRPLIEELRRLEDEALLAASPFKVGDIVQCHYGRSGSYMKKSTETTRRYQVVEVRPSPLSRSEVALFGRQFKSDGTLSDKVTDLKWKHPQKAVEGTA